jgi:hypothetical protein
MNILEYRVLDPNLLNPAGAKLRAMVRNRDKRAAWIMENMENFVRADTNESDRRAPELAPGQCEVYATPPAYDIDKPPGAVALVRVDHRHRTIELVDIVVEHPRPEGPMRDHIAAIARAAILGC